MNPVFIRLDDVSIEYPIYNTDARSLKRAMLTLPLGGRIGIGSGDRIVVQALRSVSLRFESGDRVGLIGHNGAGKTTLLRVLAGVYEPVTGRTETSGRIASLFDMMLGMDPEATGEENIMIRGLILGLGAEQIRAKRDEIAEFTELGEFLTMPVRTYSTGMRLRLAFAISSCVTPDILLMDEWIGVADESFTRKAEERARALIGDVGILVLATHSLPLMEHICNRVVWLENGAVKADGPPAEILRRYRDGAAPA